MAHRADLANLSFAGTTQPSHGVQGQWSSPPHVRPRILCLNYHRLRQCVACNLPHCTIGGGAANRMLWGKPNSFHGTGFVATIVGEDGDAFPDTHLSDELRGVVDEAPRFVDALVSTVYLAATARGVTPATVLCGGDLLIQEDHRQC